MLFFLERKWNGPRFPSMNASYSSVAAISEIRSLSVYCIPASVPIASLGIGDFSWKLDFVVALENPLSTRNISIRPSDLKILIFSAQPGGMQNKTKKAVWLCTIVLPSPFIKPTRLKRTGEVFISTTPIRENLVARLDVLMFVVVLLQLLLVLGCC